MDNRIPPPDAKQGALLLPRLVLAVPRLIVKGISIPIGWFMRFEERHQILKRMLSALTSEDGLIGVRLAFEFALDFRPIVGLAFFDKRIFGHGTSLRIEAMTGGRDLAIIRAHLQPFEPRQVQLGIDVTYLRRDDQIFNGIRSITPANVDLIRSRFSTDAFDVATRLRLRPLQRFSVSFLAQFGLRRYGDGRETSSEPTISEAYCVRTPEGLCLPGGVDDRLVPGFHQGTQFARVGAGLRFDSRNSPSKPAGGFMLELDGNYSHGLGDPSSYFQVLGAATGVINLYRGSHILVLRLSSQMVLPTGDELVPFTELVTLGGPDTLRGFRWGRFRDFSSLIATVEYRWPIWIWAEGMLFADYGGTFARNFQNFDWTQLRPDVGMGIRVRTSSQVMMRIQVAYGFPDGMQFYFVTTAGP
jgi:outer membrane protein assembly factor BamA